MAAPTAATESEAARCPKPTRHRMHIAANNDCVRAPMDATPSPDAARVYYTALSREDGDDSPACSRSRRVGSNEIATLAVGDELTAPVGITVEPRRREALCRRHRRGRERERRHWGAAHVSPQTATMSIVEGTEGYAPAARDRRASAGKEQLYFSGTDPETGQGGVFRIAPGGGTSSRSRPTWRSTIPAAWPWPTTAMSTWSMCCRTTAREPRAAPRRASDRRRARHRCRLSGRRRDHARRRHGAVSGTRSAHAHATWSICSTPPAATCPWCPSRSPASPNRPVCTARTIQHVRVGRQRGQRLGHGLHARALKPRFLGITTWRTRHE